MFSGTAYRSRQVCAGILLAGTLLAGTISAQQPAPRQFQPQQRAVSNHYSPRFMRPATANAGARTIFNQNVDGAVMAPTVQSGPVIEEYPGFEPVGEYGLYDDGAYHEGAFVDGGACGGCAFPACDDCYGCGPAIDPRDCQIPDDCWLGGIGALFCNSEFFSGAHGFKVQEFRNPQTESTVENCSFGFHAGFNTGLPLYRLTCGLVSGQVGVRSVQSNFEEGLSFRGDRQQTFFTGGLYRRVDYGLQFGTVADILHEEWDSTLDLAQIRAELSWVWPVGHTLGFRFAENVQDDEGFVGSVFLPDVNAQSIDWYRLFWRHSLCNGGYGEFSVGRSDEQHTILGVDYDIPFCGRSAVQAGFNYLAPDDTLAGTDNEAWNVYVGMSFRPRGRDWYKFYHRPLFDVADNGSMVMSRR